MNKKDERILRAIMEGMTEGLDMMGKQKTWERMLAAASGQRFKKEENGEDSLQQFAKNRADFSSPLEEVSIDRDQYHKAVIDACIEAAAGGPSLDYPEYTKDRVGVEERDVESYLSTDELMLIGQTEMIKKLRQMAKSEALREKIARRVMIKLV